MPSCDTNVTEEHFIVVKWALTYFAAVKYVLYSKCHRESEIVVGREEEGGTGDRAS